MHAGSTTLGETRAEDVHRTPDLTIGRFVLYMLTGADADQINRRRIQPHQITAAIAKGEWPLGAQAHVGNEARAGDVCPALVVRTWGPKCANLQVFLDGNDVFWKTSTTEKPAGVINTGGFWEWPART